MALLDLHDVCKTYHLGEMDLQVLKGVTLSVDKGELVALMGASGSGKSTLMNILGCLDRPSSGEYWLDGKEISGASANERARLRNRLIGFVFQSFNLLARTSALDNVSMPLTYGTEYIPEQEMKAHAAEMLRKVGLADRMGHQPSQLSGGQQQRVAIARSLVNNPKIILADEPTGALDSRTSIEIMAIFQRLNREHGITMIVVTHDSDVAAYSNRSIHFKDGRLQLDERLAQPREARKDLEQLPAELPEEVSS